MRTQASWLPGALLLAYGVAFAARAIGIGVPAFDDHPGQLARLWHVVREGPAPWAWNPGWWAGYPEMQFYPPGWFYLGALLRWITLGLAPPPAIYTVLVWLSYLAPGVTAFALLRRLLGDGWLALPGALVVLAFAGDPGGGGASGVEGGVHIGMAAARLAWAMVPLLALCLVAWMEGDPFPRAAVPLLAVIVLMHPAHGPAAVAVVAGAALVRPDRRRALLHGAIALVGAIALIAFWALPLLVRIQHTRALAWGHLAVPNVRDPFTWLLGALVVVALARRASSPWRALLHATWIGIALVVLDALALEPLGVRFLPSDRVADGAGMLVLIASGLGAGVAARTLRRRIAAPIAALAVLAIAVAFSVPGRALSLWPRAADWVTEADVWRGLRLDDLGRALRGAPPGRVLFIRSGVPLVFGTEWYRPHTHVTALTPLATGRDIIGGTFTHGAPVAALVYRGDAGPGAIDRLSERLDGQSLFGRPLDALDADTVDAFARRFRVTVIVALEDDAPHLPFLAGRTRYRPLAVPPFLLFITEEAAARGPLRVGPATWEVDVTGEAGAWTSTGVGYYPLWRAESAGRAIPVRRGLAGDLEVRRDGASRTVRLTYGAGTVEVIGGALSVLALVALGADAWRRRGNPSP